jgi:hypothetical protein
MAELVYTAHHRIVYNTKNPVPISDVILALQGLEGLLKSVPRVMEQITGTDILRTEYYIDRVESGSLIEDVILKFFFNDKEGLDKFLDKMKGNGLVKGTVIAAIIGGVVTYAGMSAVGAMKGQAANITANNNTIINIGAGEVKMTPEEFRSIVASAVGDRKAAARDAVKFLTPARNNPGSSVEIGDQVGHIVEVTNEAIAETPKTFDSIKNQKEVELGKVTVEIRATDLDNRKTGWAGKIDGITGRVRIELDPLLKESVLFGKASVLADVTVTSIVKSGSSEYTPSKITIHSIH